MQELFPLVIYSASSGSFFKIALTKGKRGARLPVWVVAGAGWSRPDGTAGGACRQAGNSGLAANTKLKWGE